MKVLILVLLFSSNLFANEVVVDENEVVVDENSYAAFTVPRDISLYEEDGGALLVEDGDFQCSLTRKEFDDPEDKVIIKKGTTIIFGGYNLTGDHSSGIGVSWKALNVEQIGELECWLDNAREGLTLVEIITEILEKM